MRSSDLVEPTNSVAYAGGDRPGAVRGSVERDRPEMPVPCDQGAVEKQRGAVRGGDQKLADEPVVAAQDETAQDETAHDETVGRGWVVPPGGTRAKALFMISRGRLGIGRSDSEEPPVWLDLADIENLDAIGDPVEDLSEIEIRMVDGALFSVGWTQGFCDAIVEALRATIDSCGTGGPEKPSAAPSGVLELEDVTYLSGYPGEGRRRKRCTAVLSETALEVSGPSDMRIRIAWESVRSIEAQNSDEARFRTNTKIHRDSSALVIECGEGITVLLEARDCPTIPLRSAIETLLVGTGVQVS